MSDCPKVVITGANGFIGSALVAYFRDLGWSVVALVHRVPPEQLEGVSYQLFDLGTKPDPQAFEGARFLIHGAFAKDNYQLNVEGTEKLLSVARTSGISTCVFLSSLSAHPNSETVYGKQKYAVELLFAGPGDCIVRPGLVLGQGGLVGDMIAFIHKYKIIPLVGGGKQPLQTLYIGDLKLGMERILVKGLTGVLTLAAPEAVPYRKFFSALCETSGLRARFISIPLFFLNGVVKISSLFRFKLPVSGDSLRGVAYLKAVDVSEDLRRLGVAPIPYDRSLKLILEKSE